MLRLLKLCLLQCQYAICEANCNSTFASILHENAQTYLYLVSDRFEKVFSSKKEKPKIKLNQGEKSNGNQIQS